MTICLPILIFWVVEIWIFVSTSSVYAFAPTSGGGAAAQAWCGWPSDLSSVALRHHDQHICQLPITGVPGSRIQEPWTHIPFCVNDEYCVYTVASFPGGDRGLSLVTTPTAASSATGRLQQAFSRSLTNTTIRSNPANTPYVVKEIPGKGRGVVAYRSIRRGELLMADHASIMVDVKMPSTISRKDVYLLMNQAVKQLPEPERVLGLSKSSKHKTLEVEDVLRTNSFTAILDGRPYMALFPEVARINHDCDPNSFARFSQKTLAMSIIAYRDINPGEEITISYLEIGEQSPARKDKLKRRWGFDCTCNLCTSPPTKRHASDIRRKHIQELRKQILESSKNADFRKAISLNEELLNLAEEEGLVAHLGETYEILAQLCHLVGDRDGEERYGKLALEDLRVFGGKDGYEGVRSLADLLGRL